MDILPCTNMKSFFSYVCFYSEVCFEITLQILPKALNGHSNIILQVKLILPLNYYSNHMY